MDSENRGSRTDKPIALIAVTRNGAGLALQLQAKLEGSVCYVPVRHRFAVAMGAVGFQRVGALFPEIWGKSSALICIMATGIAVRGIAPLLRHKTVDPAVVVLDERGQFVVSLLSGHLGGANQLAREVARLTGGQAVITTASDVQKKPALDLIAQEAELEIENMEMLSRLARAILEDEPVWLYDPEERLKPFLADLPNVFPLLERAREEAGEPEPRPGGNAAELSTDQFGKRVPLFSKGGRRNTGDSGHPLDLESAPVGLWTSERSAPPELRCLVLRPRNLVVGIGCNRGTTAEEIQSLLQAVFRREGLSLLSIRNLASVDIKSDEPGILEVARQIERPVRFFSRKEIENIQVPNPSGIVAKHIGVRSVCEATALLSALSETIIVEKQKTANATLAVARVAFPS